MFQRLGSEGYKLFCEPQLLTPPATILPNKLGLRRRFTIEPGGSCTSIHDTPESSSRSDFSEPSTSTPKVIRRYSIKKPVMGFIYVVLFLLMFIGKEVTKFEFSMCRFD